MSLSPSGKPVVASVGPSDADYLLVSSSPSVKDVAAGIPLTGRTGEVLNQCMIPAGIDRGRCRIVNLVPVHAPHDRFEEHDPRDVALGLELFKDEVKAFKGKAVIALGPEAWTWLTGYGQEFEKWVGSVVPYWAPRQLSSYHDYLLLVQPGHSRYVIAAFHPTAVARDFEKHPLLIEGLKKARALVDGTYQWPVVRPMYINEVERAFAELDRVDMFAFDTELTPWWMLGFATDQEVHVLDWKQEYREKLEQVFMSKNKLKIAHNLQHDVAMNLRRFGFRTNPPWYDTMGGAHTLNTELPKSLARIQSSFTGWPYHKWLLEVDPHRYNGMDCVGAYDAYWPQIDKASQEKLLGVLENDHSLLEPLLDMQFTGVIVDESKRASTEAGLQEELATAVTELNELVKPVVDARLSKFKKPHLFEEQRRCNHCGGGALQSKHCWRCAGLPEKPVTKEGYGWIRDIAKKDTLKSMKEALPECTICRGTGKITVRLPFNPNSPDQLSDVLYRGLGLKVRRFKGEETVRIDQLEPLAGEPFVAKVIAAGKKQAELETVQRLRPGADGRLHSVFDPWGTRAGRVASREGLLDVGTNLMNVPEKARTMIIPPPGYVFLYPDMSQVEARAMAVLSQDKNLLAGIYEVLPEIGKPDLHWRLVFQLRKLLGLPELSRDQIKVGHYGMFYGGQGDQLAVEMTAMAVKRGKGQALTGEQGRLMVETVDRLIYPGITAWRLKAAQEVLETREYRNPVTGRKRHWTGYIYDSKTKALKHDVAKEVWAFPNQDIGAWVLAEGIRRVRRENWDFMPGLVHVHDATLFIAPEDRLPEAVRIGTDALTMKLWGMDFECEMKVGLNWREMLPPSQFQEMREKGMSYAEWKSK